MVPASSGQLAGHLGADVVDRPADRHEAGDPPGDDDRDHRAHRGPEGAGERLDDGPAGHRRRDRAAEPPADLRGIGMGVPDAVGRHDHDEVGAGVPLDLLRERLEHRGRVGRGEARHDDGGGGQGVGDAEDLVLRRVGVGRRRVGEGGEPGAEQHDQDHRGLEGEQLGGEAPGPRPRIPRATTRSGERDRSSSPTSPPARPDAAKVAFATSTAPKATLAASGPQRRSGGRWWSGSGRYRYSSSGRPLPPP